MSALADLCALHGHAPHYTLTLQDTNPRPITCGCGAVTYTLKPCRCGADIIDGAEMCPACTATDLRARIALVVGNPCGRCQAQNDHYRAALAEIAAGEALERYAWCRAVAREALQTDRVCPKCDGTDWRGATDGPYGICMTCGYEDGGDPPYA